MINCLTKDHHDRIWDNQIVLTIDGLALCYYNTETKTVSDLQTDVCINKWEKWSAPYGAEEIDVMCATYSCTNDFGEFITKLTINEVTITLKNKVIYKSKYR